MKDSLALLVTAIVVAIAAWAFWHFLGADALQVFSLLATIVLLADNVRLRRRLRESKP